MSTDTSGLLLVLAIVAFGIFTIYRLIKFVAETRLHRMKEAFQAKAEAMFQSQFPELQPHFHPRAVAKYALAYHQRRKREPFAEWQDPPGFPAARLAQVTRMEKGARTVLIDGEGGRLGEFLYNPDDRPEVIATLRLGQGKFTVRQPPKAPTSVKYWHPAREFTWKGEGMWSFKTPVADEPISSTPDRTSWSSDTSSSSSSSSRAAAAAAFAGAGGAFDGGGASQGWDDASTAHSAGGDADAAVAASDSSGPDSGASESSTSY